MPREKIKVTEDGSVLSLGWNKETGEIQFVANTMLPVPIVTGRSGPEPAPLATASDAILGSADFPSATEPETYHDVYAYFPVDRRQINNLINLLRQVRDQVLGKDA